MESKDERHKGAEINESITGSKVDFGYSTSIQLVVEDVVNSGQKMAEEALFPVK